MAVVPVDLHQARRVLGASAATTAALLRSCPDPLVAVPGLGWSVAQVAAHLRGAAEGFAASAAGRPLQLNLPDAPAKQRLAYLNAHTVQGVQEPDPAVVAGWVEQGARAFLEATRGRRGHERVPTPWYGQDVSLDLDAATCVLVGEQLVHGWDVATAVRRPWPIPPGHAALALAGLTAMIPLFVDPAAAAGVAATYDIRVRGGVRFAVVAADGALTVTPPITAKVDCHVVLEPVAGLLVAYGRQGQWLPIVRGKLVAWGRRPWLGLGFKNLVLEP